MPNSPQRSVHRSASPGATPRRGRSVMGTILAHRPGARGRLDATAAGVFHYPAVTMSPSTTSTGGAAGVRAAALVPLAMLPVTVTVLGATRIARIAFSDFTRSGVPGETAVLQALAGPSGPVALGLLVAPVGLLVLLPFVASACWRAPSASRRDAWRVLVVAGAALQAVLLTGVLALAES